jgi:hypothetical protein
VDCVLASAKKDPKSKSRPGGVPNRTTDGGVPCASALATGQLPDGAVSEEAPSAPVAAAGTVDAGFGEAISGSVRCHPCPLGLGVSMLWLACCG